KLVRQFHPDANKNNPQAEERFKEAQEAYDVLSDAQKRQNYDQFGHAGVGVNAGGGREAAYEAYRRGGGERRGGGGGGGGGGAPGGGVLFCVVGGGVGV